MTLRVWSRRHPEWWPLCLGVLAWILLIRADPRAISIHTDLRALALHHTGTAREVSPQPWTFGLMLIATLMPGMIGSIRATVAVSLWRRRQRALSEYLAGFFSVWILAGAIFLTAVALATRTGHLRLDSATGAIALTAAALWQLTATKRRALNAHRRTHPLAPAGWRADRDCMVAGFASGSQCLLSCGPMMSAMALGAHSLVVMVVMAVMVMGERYLHRPPQSVNALVLGGLAALFSAS
jgi:Predicted metal-binding integral membrane protein (DUF2182)